MSTFTDKHKNDLKLQLNAIVKQIRDQQPQHGDAVEKRITEDLYRQADMVLEKLESIRTSGRFSPDGEQKERRLAVHSFTQEHLARVRAATVEKIATQREEQRAALVKPKKTKEPLEALLQEMKHREHRDYLRKEDRSLLEARIRQTEDTDFLDALEGAPAGFPIAPAELIQEARTRIAEKNHPELGELAALQGAYNFAIGATEQVILAASGLTKMELVGDPTPAPHEPMKPILVSTGKPV